ncbi:enoyl-CoA hydratase/isomerase family protein [Saccharopolyspora mangrovi]|uniref:Enoyl-CoA hydratase/isomerase family protein n=1 Tax=Saccharopolyspora mangrovi TaxID=3082379 RepID=A0ABU6A4B7_9PSEU|nr:enoyl-CoA hydratase/isomerase family protein [Saccharopolyspora sp. S2-29]MEB3366413.1 enoyl-CoA hydratase/isomerase family protein [Saccharopolyspora sp. S2-29]
MTAELTRFTRSEPHPGVLQLTMSRPEKLNAMDQAWFRELREVMDGLGEEGDGGGAVRAVIITGAGRAFSAGGDIDMFAGLDGDVHRTRPHLRRVYEAFHAVERCAVPVIAAVNGLAYGGGTELALACDVVLAGQSARFAFKEPAVGLMPGFGVVRGPAVMGRHWTRYLALSGRDIDAERAERAGVVQEVHPDESLLSEAVSLAAEIASRPSLAVRCAKAFINRDTDGGFNESVEATALLFGTDEHRDAVKAFRESRASGG